MAAMNTVLEGAPSRRLVLREDEFSGLKPMLQAGIGIRAKPGRTLRPFLTADLGFDPAYVEETMQSHVVYRLVRDSSGSLVAAASAETSLEHRNAEMTDFATLPSQRGLGLAQHLLAALEHDMADRGIRSLYTIARARSAGMNRVFYNRGYELTGTLVNNCHIAGQLEDMHVWCHGHRRRAGQ